MLMTPYAVVISGLKDVLLLNSELERLGKTLSQAAEELRKQKAKQHTQNKTEDNGLPTVH